MAVESKFREDKDLAFLQYADWQDLKVLANSLIKDHSGKEQWTGGLKKSLDKSIAMYPESKEQAYKNSWKSIAAELQLYGGDTFANLTRGKGVTYQEIVFDVAKKVGVDVHKDTANISDVEEKILRLLFQRVLTMDDIGYMYRTLEDKGLLGLTSLKSKPWNTVKNAVGLNGNAGAVAGAGAIFAGIKMIPKLAKVNPIVTAATLPLTIKDFSSTAYRVTIPAVCIVAMMRTKYTKNSADYDEF